MEPYRANTFKEILIAPCGINCGTCKVYLRERNSCSGCRNSELNKPKTRSLCKIKNCTELVGTVSGFCHECGTFPCIFLKKIEKRYRLKYRTSLIENLISLRSEGMNKYLEGESERWICRNCGGVLSIHIPKCMNCNVEYNNTNFRNVKI